MNRLDMTCFKVIEYNNLITAFNKSVNCIVLGRAEAFAAKNNPLASMFDGIGMGFGFTIALTLLGAVREFLGTGKIFNLTILPEEYGMLIFVLAPGAFIALGYLIAIINSLKKA